MDSRTSEGFLVLADISGYTGFLTGSELEHAHAIVRELIGLLRAQLIPPLPFVKLEGDAVFCYADRSAFRDGERLVEVVESCYFSFTNRVQDIIRSTTCDCRACRSVGGLDLKVLAHHGIFVVDDDDGREDLTGSDVILVHRLLKNTIGDGGAATGYAFFTAECLERLPSTLAVTPHAESVDGFGPVAGGVQDLRAAPTSAGRPASSASRPRMRISRWWPSSPSSRSCCGTTASTRSSASGGCASSSAPNPTW